MNKVILGLVLAAAISVAPAFAQKPSGGNHGNNGGSHQTSAQAHNQSRPAQHAQSQRSQQPQHEVRQQRPQARQHQDVRQHQQVQRQHQYNRDTRGDYRDHSGRAYDRSRFGRDHYAHFDRNGGRYYHGRRGYPFGGYWFYGEWPGWFYDPCGSYFELGPDGFWYAHSYCNAGLSFQVEVE